MRGVCVVTGFGSKAMHTPSLKHQAEGNKVMRVPERARLRVQWKVAIKGFGLLDVYF